MRFFSFRIPLALELGGQRGQGGGRFFRREVGGGREGLLHLFKIRRVIGAQVEHPVWGENARGQGGKVRVDQPVAAVFVLGPWVGKVNVDGLE